MTTRLHHVVKGPEGTPAVLLGSSLGTTLEIWEPVAEKLSECFRTVLYDHRGHGRSPLPAAPYELEALARDVLALMDELQIAEAVLGGLSLGAMVSIAAALEAPSRVSGLVLCCTSAHLPHGWADRAAAVRAAGTTEIIADAVVGRWLTPDFAAAHRDELARLRAMLVRSPAEGYAACCEAIGRMDLRLGLEFIGAPALVVAGVDDEATPVGHLRTIASLVPDARLELLPNAAHLACVERPAEVGQLILDYLEELS